MRCNQSFIGATISHRNLCSCLNFFVLLGFLFTGCSQYIDPNVPEPIHPLIDPELNTPYELYRPSSYDRLSNWPLIVACHSWPGDSPNKQIRDWTLLAETYGFVVVAPRLEGTKSFWPPRADQQIALQKKDEQRILSTLRHVQASHNISDDRIFIHGYSGATHIALYTGLRHPDIFRAISIIQPYFNSGFLAGIDRVQDTDQSVYIHFSIDDSIIGKHADRCIDWLRAKGLTPLEDSSGLARRTECQKVVEYYQSVIRNQPWIHIRALQNNRNNPLEIQFKLRCSIQAQRYEWSFGDGHKTHQTHPVHQFTQAGSYIVTVTIEDQMGKQHTRTSQLVLPSGRLITVNETFSKNP